MPNPSPAAIEKYLKGIDFPASRDSMVQFAQNHGATSDILDILRRIPDKTYTSPIDVAKGIGEVE
ncbi:MAG: DUF2795 domain-containing protein [Candidatus Margulisiibacteriota bacterium]|nr:MAG: hypothetical protein A2X43_06950 [Candidatus Margulisbacteria bacterium GWD2_39_127]OGI02981.1 MAG: hypothetical protein A2X42_12885 [Candidatus Margulisbacteria bacterium GWF2_38_17]OGI09426.1 MAG: hypothetical protein A2X41_12360 [Candidatus Margulisbacteria bacterium GWE2_39_32]PZM78774.1 MAG: DUF2795 domain-containing protein [Candidatus Margulisiibacteriota bacterium]HAR63323.1 hypothetical protein [Candidatus Margulisiibacteriota bacterium]